MVNMPVDYRKWDHIEVSDDEDDTHPNVDTPSLFRWRHQARMERTAEIKREKEEFQENSLQHQRKMVEIQNRLAAVDVSDAEKQKLQIELSELKKQEDEYRRKEAELAKKERLQPLNVDTIGHDGFSKSRINKIEAATAATSVDEETRNEELKKFMKDNTEHLKKFGMLRKWEDSKQFLLEHPQLCCEDAANHLVLECLDLEMEEKHDLMEHVAHQTIIIQYLLELAKQMKVSPKAPQLISSFFSKLKLADKMYHDAFEDELTSFKERIRKRAQEKIEEAMREYEEEERQKRMGPGGLDPLEVFATLPQAMKECFESQNIAQLQTVAATMPREQFEHHLKRCVDSGLWIPDGGAKKTADNADEKPAETMMNVEEENKETELRQRKTT